MHHERSCSQRWTSRASPFLMVMRRIGPRHGHIKHAISCVFSLLAPQRCYRT